MARRKKVSLGNHSPKLIQIDESIPSRPSVVYKEVIQYDKDGEVISQNSGRVFSKNGSGFVLSYTAKMDEFIKKTPTASVVRVFIYLAHHQGYGIDGVFGYRCTRQHISDALGLTRRSVYNALEYLIGEFLVNEIRVAGTLEFMVNPAYVTVGNDRKARDREWSQRWEFYHKHQADKERNDYCDRKNSSSERTSD